MRRRSTGVQALRLAPVVLVAVWLGLVTAVPADGAGARFVAQLNAAIGKGLAQAPHPQERARAICSDIAASLLDIDAMMDVASAGATAHMNDQHREAFRAALLRRLLRDCVANAPDYLAGPVTLAGTRQLASGQMLVGTRSQGAGEAKTLMWQVRPGGQGGYLANDLLIDGMSAMQRLRDQSQLSLERSPGDIAALIETVGR